jgi:diguanylate cyclase (GGDEF)-like protein/PAS domain S-box-containing protein
LLENLPSTFTEDSFHVFKKALVYLANDRPLLEAETTQRTLGGETRYVFMRVFLASSVTGKFSRVIASMVDITERRRVEQSLSEMRARLHLLSENLDDAALYIYSHDPSGQFRFEYLSAGIENLTGVKPEVVLQNAASLHALILPEYLPQLVELETRSKQDLKSFSMEIRQRHALTGAIHWALLRSTPRRRPDGSTVWYGVQIDITDRKRSEKLLEEANEQLRRHVAEIELLQAELRQQALHDPLTGLFNRRYLAESTTREIARARRLKDALSIIVSDIDQFKTINDTHGHQVGDQFLVEVASVMKNNARSSDIVCRYGGEEFLLVLPGTPLEAAAKRAEELRQKCAEIVVWHENQPLSVTLSFGVATYPTHGSEAEEIIIKADKALYQSKNDGRNRVTVWK